MEGGQNGLRIMSVVRVYVKDIERLGCAARLLLNKLLPECVRTCNMSNSYFHPFCFTCYTENDQCGHADGGQSPPETLLGISLIICHTRLW